jgi:pimeloyl-ACP methyl ester carboxylesterase
VILETGAELRITGEAGPAVVCVNGGRAHAVPGTWSATIEWLVPRLVLRHPGLRFAEVRYRIKSWRHLDECIADMRAAVAELGAPRTLLLGFSMGGGVSVACAAEPTVESVLGIAPWIPDRLSVEPLRGKRLRVLHGSLDRALPGVPGVSPALARRGFERARTIGVDGEFTVIRGALHGVAVRSPWGALVALPRAGRWLDLVSDEIGRFARNDGGGRGSMGR